MEQPSHSGIHDEINRNYKLQEAKLESLKERLLSEEIDAAYAEDKGEHDKVYTANIRRNRHIQEQKDYAIEICALEFAKFIHRLILKKGGKEEDTWMQAACYLRQVDDNLLELAAGMHQYFKNHPLLYLHRVPPSHVIISQARDAIEHFIAEEQKLLDE
jgi:hypothetical protein